MARRHRPSTPATSRKLSARAIRPAQALDRERLQPQDPAPAAIQSFRPLGVAASGRLGRRGFPGLSAGLAGRVDLGRRRPRDPPRTALVARTVPHLVRRAGHAAILPAAAQRLLGRAQALGRRHARLSPGQLCCCTPWRPCMVALILPPAGDPGGLSGGGHLRAASGPRGIGGLDHGAEEHPLGRVLPGGHAGLPPLRPDAEDGVVPGRRWDCSCWPC